MIGSSYSLACAILFFCFAGTLPATTLNYTGEGADLDVATSDGSGNVVVGITTLTIPVTDFYIVDIGDSVTVSLTGLLYPFAGDLQVRLSLRDNLNNFLMGGDVFNRIGLTNPLDPNDVGYDTQFGNSIDSGNYVFNSAFTTPVTNDLWTTASFLGSSDAIPSGNYWPTTALSNNNDSLSTIFGGLPINGNWILEILDYYPPDPGVSYTPGIVGWGLTIQATASAADPEPSTAILIGLSIAFWLPTMWRRLVSSSYKIRRS